jgi:photosystem II stability/assembly factor-like uncharacterized protein
MTRVPLARNVRMRAMRILTLTLVATLAIFCVASAEIPRSGPRSELRPDTRPPLAADDVFWSVQTSGLDTNLRGVSAAYLGNAIAGQPGDVFGVRSIVVWVCGSNGVILVSYDLGKTWERRHVRGGDSLDFRSIVAFDGKTALVMSSGEGEKSRIYETKDGGETWKLEFTGEQPTFFLDALVCGAECYALSDPVDGKFVILATHHYKDWKELPSDGMPAALPGEGAFAASGTSLALGTDRAMYFGTGGAAAARVFHSTNSGKTWTVTNVPMAIGNASSGIFSLALVGNTAVIAVGGDYKDPTRPFRVAAYSLDDGKTWQLAAQPPGGYRSAVVSLFGSALAVGPNGEDISDDLGAHWKHIGTLDLNAASVLDIHNAWAVGAKGTIARLINHKEYLIQNSVVREGSARESAYLRP